MPITSSDLFLSLPDATALMPLTNFLQGTALNHCLWCGIEDNRCRRHVLDHWRELCEGDGRCGRDMECETETSTVQRVLTDETRLALLVRLLWLWHLMLGVALDAVHLVDIVEVPSSRHTSGWSCDGSVTQEQTHYPLDQKGPL